MQNGRCKMHGGKNPAGIASPNWKTGRWAASIGNTALREHFYAALSDSTLLKNQQDVAMLDALVANLVGQLKPGRPVTAVQERRLADLIERRQRAVMNLARTERDLQLWVHGTKHRQVIEALVNVLRDHLVLPDGQPNLAVLRTAQERVRLIVAQSNVVEGEVIEDGDNGDGTPGS